MRGPLVVLLVCAACGPARAPAPPSAINPALPASQPASYPVLARSSIAAVLVHREELGLSDDQVHALIARDDELARETESIRESARAHRAAAASQPAQQPQATGQGGHGYGGGGGGGMGMGRHGGGGGGHHGGHAGAASQPARTHLQDRLDDADTRAYLRAEADILLEGQREKARDFAEQYREALYDRRERQGNPEDE